VISANKLYTGSMDSINFGKDREEIVAWTDKISLKNIPQSQEEKARLRQYEEIMKNENKQRSGFKPIDFRR